ncbi:MAG: MFS transporter, partial [Chloroflexota bacterium]
QYIKALSPQGAGLILLAQPVMMATISPLAGRLSDRIEPRIVASMGMGLTASALFLLSSLAETTAVHVIVANLALLGLGLALFTSPNTNAIMSSVESRFYGVASATTGTMRLGGQMLSMGIAMLMFALYMGKVQITPEYYPVFLASIKSVISIFAVLCCLGVLASLARGRVRRGEVSRG